ncbi:MAG TPA: rhodanese-like domain-containing protein [Burkholderiales bacterium]|nr:rhodanese-like domain-containing protein [Burkholderiales bacterium]
MSKPGTVTARQLKAMIHDGGELALLDVREAGQFGESHLLFATPLPYSRLELDVAALVPRKSARVVLCDDDGARLAALAAKRLGNMGYSDVAVLEGGTRGWAAAGYTLFSGVNVPSKLFGELVEHEYGTPRISVTELARMKEAGEDFVIVDGRPYSEYQKMNIPGGICCPNAELPYRIGELVANPATRIIVNCAGRTRSIMGAQILLSFGVPNPVFALENGTQGWVLADFELERGASRRYPDHVSEADLPRLTARTAELMKRHGVRSVSENDVEGWLIDGTRTTYLLDVRTPEEFGMGSLPGAVHAPGGQLIQATDQWVGVRNARIVLIDGEGVRAGVVASWLAQLGCEAYVLEGGVGAQVSATGAASPQLSTVAGITAEALKPAVDSGTVRVFDLGGSMSFRKAHIPGSRWSTRTRIVADATDAAGPVVLAADDPRIAQLAAIDLTEAGITNVRVLEGGLAAWSQAGYPTESSADVPPDGECIDHLFFVHDRHAGNREAMRQYLAWETGLIAQLDAEDRTLFKVGAAV